MKVVSITGHKNTKKVWLAEKLAENSDVEYVTPYVGVKLPQKMTPEEFGHYHVVLPTVLEDMERDEEVLYSVRLNGRKYVYFKFQMTADYNVVILDDYGVLSFRERWDGDLYSIFVIGKTFEPSKRVEEFLTRHEFDEIFNVETDDINELEARIE